MQTRTKPGGAPIAHVALGALGLASVAMLALHIVQQARDPLQQPVSFYVHGEHGWLLTASLAFFGIAAIAVAFAVRERDLRGHETRLLGLFGAGMLLTAVVPSDRWFPWEASPTITGVIHAAAAVFAPALLLHPMIASLRRTSGHRRCFEAFFALCYCAGLIASALALAIGFARDTPPPLIGLAERVLAFSSVSWLAIIASARVAREFPGGMRILE